MTKNKTKRRYNACYRLKKRGGGINLPNLSRIIYVHYEKDINELPEVQILLNEFGFIIQPFF